MSERVREILSWYAGNPPGVLANLHLMLMAGRLGEAEKWSFCPWTKALSMVQHAPLPGTLRDTTPVIILNWPSRADAVRMLPP